MNRFHIKRLMRKEMNGWRMLSIIGAAVILLPILYVFSSLFSRPNENWLHIRKYLLTDYIIESLLLVCITGLLAGTIGVTLAWLISAYDFPLKRIFRWALVLPLAIPPYIAAYTYSTMFSYTGVVQSTLRNSFDIRVDPLLFSLTGMKGAIFVFVLFLFPYVYLIARSFLESQSAAYVESARVLGRSPLYIFFRIVLPLSRPALAGGIVLVIYEVLSDYGVTSYFGIHTFTTAIFQTWFGRYDVDSAMKLAAWLMVFVVGIFFVERWLRKERSYSAMVRSRPMSAIRLSGWKSAAAVTVCAIVLALGFLIPTLQLIAWAKLTFDAVWNSTFFRLAYQTVWTAAVSTTAIMLFAVIVANANRRKSLFSFVLVKSVTAGYSIPGAIIAIGVLAICIALDRMLAPVYGMLGWGDAPLVLSMSIVMLLVGYVIRYMATGYNAVEVGFEKIGNKYMEASRTLSHSFTASFFKVELPLLKGAIAGGFILTFVEICKELPLALLLRPFNFETLATKAYQYANDEQIYEASIPSLFIIAISILSVVFIHHTGKKVQS